MKQETKKRIQWISTVLFIVYLILISYFLFFAESLGRDFTNREYSYNIHLFREMIRFWEYRAELGNQAVVLNLGGNVFCFIPFGAILPVLNIRFRSFFRILSAGFAFSLIIEIIQLVSKTGSFDVDDLFLNTIGVGLGYLLFTICNILRRKYYG